MKKIFPLVLAAVLIVPVSAHGATKKATIKAELTKLQNASRGGALADVSAEGERLATCIADRMTELGDARGAITLEQLTVASLSYTPSRSAAKATAIARRVKKVAVRSALARRLRTLGATGYTLQAQTIRLPVPDPDIACAQWVAVIGGQLQAPQWLLAVTDTAQALAIFEAKVLRADRSVTAAGLPKSLTPSGGLFE